MYVDIKDICSKCGNEIPNQTQSHYLSLIDRLNPTCIVTDDGDPVMMPHPLWEYCLCDKCFNEFNSQTHFPYKGAPKGI